MKFLLKYSTEDLLSETFSPFNAFVTLGNELRSVFPKGGKSLFAIRKCKLEKKCSTYTVNLTVNLPLLCKKSYSHFKQ